jgi:uncharacterized protein YecA (UPF0149 family)
MSKLLRAGQPATAIIQLLASEQQMHKGGKDVGRNDPCLCGSGKKYKKCCGANR